MNRLTPPATPLELRERMVASYRASYARAGLKATPAEIERQAIADLQLVDAARAAGELHGGGKPTPDKRTRQKSRGRSRVDELGRTAAIGGVRVVGADEQAKPLRFKSLHQNPMLTSERWGAAVARIARILQGVARKSSIVLACEGAELGALAVEFGDVYGHFQLRHQKPPAAGRKDRNPFRGLSDRDASRKFMRLIEDICDKSTGKLGSWFTGGPVGRGARK